VNAHDEKAGPDKVMSARDVLATFQKNAARVDERFLDKKLRVTGKVYRVDRLAASARLGDLKGSKDHYYILIFADDKKDAKGPKAPYPSQAMPLAFVFPVSSRKQLAQLDEGQQVTVEGVCKGGDRGQFFSIIFTECKIVKGK
jgi:hypothetical protein